MTTEQAMNEHFEKTGIYRPGCTRADWYRWHLGYLKLGSWTVPFFPVLRRNGPIVLHDVHHMISGYAPTWKGEAELAGWELGSGGCGWHLFYWLDRLAFLLIGLILWPDATTRAFLRGRAGRNVFRMKPEEVLRTDLDELRSYTRMTAIGEPSSST